MSTFASLLPSLQAAFFSKTQPTVEGEIKVQPEEGSQAVQEGCAGRPTAVPLGSVDNTTSVLDRPSGVRSTSSTSSALSASSDADEKPKVPGLVWKDGRRVDYDADGKIRGSKDEMRQRKEKRKQETEVSPLLPCPFPKH